MCWLHQTEGQMTSSYGSYVYTPYISIYKDKDPSQATIMGTLLRNRNDVTFTRSTQMPNTQDADPQNHSVRLVRDVTNEEIESYKHNYLGY